MGVLIFDGVMVFLNGLFTWLSYMDDRKNKRKLSPSTWFIAGVLLVTLLFTSWDIYTLYIM